MRDPDEFDLFYKDVRGRLLLLTYCLTGDLSASRAAVRDAFVAAWHHWRKVSRLEDPEAWTRVHACTHAQRRHTAKLWHREKNLDEDVRATLDALGKLPVAQRRVLLLTELTQASMSEISREIGLPRTDTERELQTATAQFSVTRDVPTTSIRNILDPVRAHIEDSRWPRPSIIRRAGATRRRTHTVIGVGATVAALVVTGMLITDTTGVRPTLSTDRAQAAGGSTSEEQTTAPADIPESNLLQASQVDRATPGTTWTTVRTHDNTGGDGLVMPCQDARFADPRGTVAQVRDFEPQGRKQAATMETVQATQASRSERAARQGYRATVAWFAACGDERAQLVDTLAVDGAGDEASMMVLRTWKGAGSTLVAGVARTGLYTTTVLTRSPPGEQPRLGRSARLLGNAVSGLCSLPDAGRCGAVPDAAPAAPLPVAPVPGMLAFVDLPPVAGIKKPWVGTDPRMARTNAAATVCDETDFSAKPMTNDATRTFLIPGSRLPDQFGLTETVGSLPEKRAAAFVDTVRDKLARCSDRQIGTDVSRVHHVDGKHRDLTVWHVTAEISDKDSVDYLMAVVRDETSVAQVGFVPAPDVGFTPEDFLAVAERAQERLEAMPRPKKD